MNVKLKRGFFLAVALSLGLGAYAADKRNKFFGIPIPDGTSPVTYSKLPPVELKVLGSITNDLLLWASLDSLDNGGVAWSKEARLGAFTTVVKMKTDAGRVAADFSAPGSILKLDPPVVLGPKYTIAAWLLLPAPKSNGVIFHGGQHAFLETSEKAFSCRIDTTNTNYAAGAAPITGWHHVALVCNGKETVFYYDGRKAGAIPQAIADTLDWIGNEPNPEKLGDRMAGAIDDVFVFGKDLSMFEVGALVKFRPPAPKKP